MMKAAWPETILFGQAEPSSEMARRTGLSSQNPIRLLARHATKEYRSSCCATKRPPSIASCDNLTGHNTSVGALSGVDQGYRNRYDLADGTAASPDINW